MEAKRPLTPSLFHWERISIIHVAGWFGALLWTCFTVYGGERRPNVLFIAIDDLRCDLGAYGVAHAKTPNLDRLVLQSRFFTRHYTQVPTCGASRAALLRGKYPEKAAHVGIMRSKARSPNG